MMNRRPKSFILICMGMGPPFHLPETSLSLRMVNPKLTNCELNALQELHVLIYRVLLHLCWRNRESLVYFGQQFTVTLLDLQLRDEKGAASSLQKGARSGMQYVINQLNFPRNESWPSISKWIHKTLPNGCGGWLAGWVGRGKALTTAPG